MRATFRPVTWTGPRTPATARRSRWTFKASWTDTLNLLDRELTYLSARDLIIEADFVEADIRLDGMPKANARQPLFPGVRVAFDSKHGALIYQTDSCDLWQHNVRSIALGLEALRAVDRYGITSHAEQYAGWKAIGAGPATPLGGMTADAAARVLIHHGQSVTGSSRYPVNRDAQTNLFRAARARAHPDRNGGDRTAWDQVETAGRVLGLL